MNTVTIGFPLDCVKGSFARCVAAFGTGRGSSEGVRGPAAGNGRPAKDRPRTQRASAALFPPYSHCLAIVNRCGKRRLRTCNAAVCGQDRGCVLPVGSKGAATVVALLVPHQGCCENLLASWEGAHSRLTICGGAVENSGRRIRFVVYILRITIAFVTNWGRGGFKLVGAFLRRAHCTQFWWVVTKR